MARRVFNVVAGGRRRLHFLGVWKLRQQPSLEVLPAFVLLPAVNEHFPLETRTWLQNAVRARQGSPRTRPRTAAVQVGAACNGTVCVSPEHGKPSDGSGTAEEAVNPAGPNSGEQRPQRRNSQRTKPRQATCVIKARPRVGTKRLGRGQAPGPPVTLSCMLMC